MECLDCRVQMSVRQEKAGEKTLSINECPECGKRLVLSEKRDILAAP